MLVTAEPNAGNNATQWLVGDQLGTPRMIVDKTGSLAEAELLWVAGAIVNYYSFQPYGFGASRAYNNGKLLVQQHWISADDAISVQCSCSRPTATTRSIGSLR